MAHTEAPVVGTKEGAVLTVAFARPEKKNALTIAMYARTVELLHEAAADPAVRAVVITGQGSTFTAGNDLMDFAQAPPVSADSPVLRFLATLVDFEKPLVAAVNGPGVGVGTTMLLHCDLVVAGASAWLQTPFLDLGLVPEGASTILLPSVCGLQKATELLLLGERVDAATAARLGIVNEVVPDAELAARAKARAEAFASKPPEALKLSKGLLRAPLRAAAHEAIRREAEVFRDRLSSQEFSEAVAAFFEKRGR